MRTVFFISDRTAITAETLGHSLLAQFENMRFREVTIPYIDTEQKAEAVIKQINQASGEEIKPIVFSTLANPGIRERVVNCHALVLDLFHVFLSPLESELESKPVQRIGLTHRISDLTQYESRIDAIDFTLLHDDGAYTKHYDQSDIILIGVSRSGKTPTCLYLSLQFAIRAANYPLTEDDLVSGTLPRVLRPFVKKLYGLTTDPERLQKIRTERRPDSRYASLEQCRYEVRAVEDLYRSKGIPFLNTTTHSVEEIATHIVQDTGLQRAYF